MSDKPYYIDDDDELVHSRLCVHQRPGSFAGFIYVFACRVGKMPVDEMSGWSTAACPREKECYEARKE